MRKPVHKVAILMWVVGAGVLLLWGWSLFDFLASYPAQTVNIGGYVIGIFAAALLIGVGTIIELVDQIRWNALPPDARKRPVSLWTYARRWPHSTSD
jgi:predicted cation transporter